MSSLVNFFPLLPHLKVRPATIFDIGSSVSDKKVSRNHSKPADRGSSLGDTGSSRQVTVSTNVVEEPPPQTLREELVQEAAEGLDTLSDQELAAWVCRGNNVLDSSIIQVFDGVAVGLFCIL